MTQKQIIVIYIGLFIICSILMLISEFLGPITSQAVLPVAVDGFKTVLGALIGALSVIYGSHQKP